jgi:hypothetical protein
MITTILTHMVHLLPLISLTLESHYLLLQANQTPTRTTMSMASAWVLPQSLSTVGALRRPISATLAHLNITVAVRLTPHGEPNAISHFPRRRYCVLRHPVLVIYSHPSSISRCTCLTAVRCECLPSRHSSPLHAGYIGGGACKLLQVVPCCPARSRRC